MHTYAKVHLEREGGNTHNIDPDAPDLHVKGNPPLLTKRPWLTAAKRYDPDDDYVLLVQQVADVLGLTDTTVRRWADEGFLRYRLTKGGHRRFSVSSVMRARGIQVGEANDFIQYFNSHERNS